MKILILSFLLLLNIQAKPLADEKKLIIVYIEMQHCPWCHKMNKETMDNPKYKAMFEKEYLLAKITKESGDVPLFLSPKYYPTTYILSSDGSQVLDELPGYMTSAHFVDYLHELYTVEMQVED
jgi:thioredoxin-related protein